MKHLLFWLCLFGVSSGQRVAVAADDAGMQKPAKLAVKVPVEMDYLLYLPKDYDEKDSWPLVLFLHGAGERGDNLELVKKHTSPRMLKPI